MSARVLVVDDMEPNVRLLAAKLGHEYYNVSTAYSGAEALAKAVCDEPDVILLDIMMPGMDGFETCRRLKEDPATRHIPVVMVTALDSSEDRVRGLDAGADDFLTKPVDDVALLARVRSLVRLKAVTDELRRREASGRALGVIEGANARDHGLGARILVIDDNPRQAARIVENLNRDHRAFLFSDAQQLGPGLKAHVDLIVISAAAKAFDGLRLVSFLRATPQLRDVGILVVVNSDEPARAVRALDLGAHDIIYRPIDSHELGVRVRAQVRRRRYAEALRESLDQSFEMAVTDQLTGLHNRRYLLSQLKPLAQRAALGGDPVALVLLDIDYFKKINDTFGHDVGDEVLKEFAARLATNVRPVDVPARFGGEEFAVMMPNTTPEKANMAAERLRAFIAAAPFRANGGRDMVSVTASLGVASVLIPEDTIDALIKRADEALYRAKAMGRNLVQAAA